MTPSSVVVALFADSPFHLLHLQSQTTYYQQIAILHIWKKCFVTHSMLI